MSENDKVILAVWTCYHTTGWYIVCNRSNADTFLAQTEEIGYQWVRIRGRVNDVDGNELEISFHREDICIVQIMEVNKM